MSRVGLDGVDKTLDCVFGRELGLLSCSYLLTFLIVFHCLDVVKLVGEASDTQGRRNAVNK